MAYPKHDLAGANFATPVARVLHLGLSELAPGTSYGPTAEACWELAWMAKGSAVAHIDGESITVRDETALLIRPGERVIYSWGSDPIVRQGFVMFATTPEAPEATWPRRVPAPPAGIVRPMLDHLLWLERERPDGWADSMAMAFHYVLRAIGGSYDAVGYEVEGALPAPIVQGLQHVGREWATHRTLTSYSLPELAEAAGVTPEHLCRLYANAVGVGPVATMRLLRLKRAAVLLTQTNMSVIEIAHATGFASEFHFSRTFKATAGLSPSSFRHDRTRAFELPRAVRQLQRHLQ
jgi:AraC family transcriptional regulator